CHSIRAIPSPSLSGQLSPRPSQSYFPPGDALTQSPRRSCSPQSHHPQLPHLASESLQSFQWTIDSPAGATFRREHRPPCRDSLQTSPFPPASYPFPFFLSDKAREQLPYYPPI